MKRKDWCEFSRHERELIKERDSCRCVFCGSPYNLQIAHIFISRAHGGKGCKKNGVILCTNCHQELDNYIGSRNRHDLIESYCKNYLIEKENLTIDDNFIKSIEFHKEL